MKYTVSTRKSGDVTFESNLDHSQVLAGLRKVNGDFAQSLRRQQTKWSPKQEAWAHYLALEAEQKSAPKPSVKSVEPSAPLATSAASLPKIVEMFGLAGESLKFPRVTFKTPAGTVRIQRNGPTSKWAGSLTVSDGGKFGGSRWYGRIDEAGEFYPGRDFRAEVLTVLLEINANPAEAMKRLGLASGRCCFCWTELTAEDSTVWGYGPVCAKHYGLPHGANKIPVHTHADKPLF